MMINYILRRRQVVAEYQTDDAVIMGRALLSFVKQNASGIG